MACANSTHNASQFTSLIGGPAVRTPRARLAPACHGWESSAWRARPRLRRHADAAVAQSHEFFALLAAIHARSPLGEASVQHQNSDSVISHRPSSTIPTAVLPCLRSGERCVIVPGTPSPPAAAPAAARCRGRPHLRQQPLAQAARRCAAKLISGGDLLAIGPPEPAHQRAS
jgi:hypothetical protein